MRVPLDKTFVYEYNNVRNIVSVKKYEYTTEDYDLTYTEQTYTYDASLPDRLTSFNGSAITYNAIGCPTSFSGYMAVWSRRKLAMLSKSGTQISYDYNALGQRISKTYSGSTDYRCEFCYDESGRLVCETKYSDSDSVIDKIIYLYDVNSIIGMVHTLNGVESTYYFQRNLFGDVIGIYNTSGVKVGGYAYDAWGNCTLTRDTTGIAYRNPIRYRGYYYDTETKLYYLNARYYNPEWRRFISPDDTAYLDPESVNGLNLYAYCNNDPVNYADPNGHLPEWAWKLIIGTIFILGGALVTALTAGTGTAFWAAFGSALLTSTIQVGISTSVSAGLGFIGGGLSTGTWEGAFTGMIEGAVDGYMWGGIISGGSQIISGLMKPGSGVSAGRVDALYKSENSTTLFNYNNAAGKSRFRIDVAKSKVKYPGGKTGFLSGKELNGLHYHFGKSNSLRNLHRFFTPGIVNGFISSGLGYFF